MSVKKISQLNPLTSNEVTSSIDLLAIVDTTNTETKKITVDNLLSGGNYSVSGSFSGSFQGDGSGITGVTGEWDGSHVGNASITGSLTVTGGVSGSFEGEANLTGSYTGSFIGDGSQLTGIATSDPLSTIISNGNTLNNGQTIDALNGGGQLDLRIGADGLVGLDTEGGSYGSSFLYIQSGSGGQSVLQFDSDSFFDARGTDVRMFSPDYIEISGSTLKPFIDSAMDIGTTSRKYKTIYGVTGSFSHLLGSSPLTVESDNFNIDSSGNITSSANISASGDLYGDNLIVGNDATFDGNITQLAGSGTTQTIANAGGVSTTDTTTTSITTLPITSTQTNTFNVKVQCKNINDTSQGGYWNLVGTFTKSNILPITINQIGSTTTLTSHEWDGNLDVRFTIVGLNVEVQVVGLALTDISWYCTYDKISMI